MLFRSVSCTIYPNALTRIITKKSVELLKTLKDEGPTEKMLDQMYSHKESVSYTHLLMFKDEIFNVPMLPSLRSIPSTLVSVSYTHLAVYKRQVQLIPFRRLDLNGIIRAVLHRTEPVSYTHLDVYKRQSQGSLPVRFVRPW